MDKLTETIVRGIVRLVGRTTWTSIDGTIVIAPRGERMTRRDRQELERLNAGG